MLRRQHQQRPTRILLFLSFRSSCLKWKMGYFKYLECTVVIITSAYLTNLFRASRRRFLLLGNSSVRPVRSGQTKVADSVHINPASSVH